MKKYRGILIVMMAGLVFILMLKYFGNKPDIMGSGTSGKSHVEDSLRLKINTFQEGFWNDSDYKNLMSEIGASEMATEINSEQLSNLKNELEVAKTKTLINSFDKIKNASCSNLNAFTNIVQLIKIQMSVMPLVEAKKRLDYQQALYHFTSLSSRKNNLLSHEYNLLNSLILISEINKAYSISEISNCYGCTSKKNSWITEINDFEDIHNGFVVVKDMSYMDRGMCDKFQNFKFYKDTLLSLGLCY